MAQSYVRSTASGSTDTFPVPFPYLDKSHVKVYLNGVATTAFTWPNNGNIKLNAGNPTAGTVVERRRVTPVDQLTVFTPGNLEASDLNNGDLQSLYLAQEADDKAVDILARAWFTTSLGAGGLIQKGALDTVPKYDASGNLIPGPTVTDVAGAQAYALAAQASAADAAASALSAGGAAGLAFVDFGADPTGVLDSTAAVQATLNFAASLGRPVRGGKGLFRIKTASVVLPAGLKWASNEDCELINDGTNPANPMFINGAIGGTFLLRSANGNIEISGVTFNANDTTTECLALGKSQNIKVVGNRFTNVRNSHFIEVNGISTATIAANTFVTMTDPGGSRSFSEAINIDFAGNYDQFPFWNAASFDKTVCQNIKVLGNTFVDCLVGVGAHGYSTYGDGTVATRSTGIDICNNTFLNCGVNTVGIQSDAIHADGFLGVTICANVIKTAKNNGIRLEDCIGYTVVGNYIENVGGNGVYSTGDALDGSNGTISGNTVRGALDIVRCEKTNGVAITGNAGFSLRNGVQLTECDNCTVTSNTAEACSGRGIYVNGVSNRNNINGNNIRNTAEANVEITGGSFNTVVGNALSLPASGKPNIKIDGGSTGVVASNVGNGATLSEHIKVTGSASHYSLMGNHFQGTAVSGVVIDSGCDNIMRNSNRYDGTYSGTIIVDNGANGVVGTDYTT